MVGGVHLAGEIEGLLSKKQRDINVLGEYIQENQKEKERRGFKRLEEEIGI